MILWIWVIDMWRQAKWLGLPPEEITEKQIWHGDLGNRFAYFRCDKTLPAGCALTLDITANSRYRLWINGRPVLSGPCKGDRFRQYYETVDVTDRLREGKNVFCAQVLYCDPDMAERETDPCASIYGVVGRQCGHRLAVEGDVRSADGAVIDTVTTGLADWRVWLDGSFALRSEDNTVYLGAVIEHIDARRSPLHWKEEGFDASGWRAAKPFAALGGEDLFRAVGVEPMFRLRAREIPLLYEREGGFCRCFDRAGNPLPLLAEGRLEVPAGEAREILLDAGIHMNAYPQLRFSGGAGARVRVTWFEKFGGPGSDLVRSDLGGEVIGNTDTIALDGSDVCWEPFWVRTFRFIRLAVEAADGPVVVHAPRFLRTGYPLPVESRVESSAPWVGKLWEICVRTLENCMLETYMDCPYYEQLQFAMDTRLEVLYTYAVSSDAALVRKALIDLHYGMQPEGLTTGKSPSAYLQILSTFSLHYIFMLCEYAQRREDPALLRLCRGDVDRILDVFDGRIGGDGLVGKLDFWNFVDWNDAWAGTGGAPAALTEGPSTVINLMYASALRDAADLMARMGREGLAGEYRQRRERILAAVEALCWDAEAGLYREGPRFAQYSRHAQAWAVLNGLRQGEAAAQLLRAAMAREDCLPCSFSTAYEWFRALEQAGLYGDMRRELEPWIGLLALDCTTCPETPKGARSDCHAWSALPIYELIRTVAGVHVGEDGRVRVAPHTMDLPDLRGQAATLRGPVRFDYRKDEAGRWQYAVTLPEGMTGLFRFPDGSETPLREGLQCLKA